jgi:hypothetical protein
MIYNSKKDFIERTIEIINDYKGNLSTTLLVNCMLGLLVVPKETYSDSIFHGDYTDTDWGIKKNSISKCQTVRGNESTKSKELIRHLRNAVSHGRFEVTSEQGKYITHIEFKDYPTSGQIEENFKAKFSVRQELKPFLLKFATSMLTP